EVLFRRTRRSARERGRRAIRHFNVTPNPVSRVLSETPLDYVPLRALLLILVASGWFSMEVGYGVGMWRRGHRSGEKDTPVGAMVASILGLLAFLLEFTFGLAAARFEVRRQTILDEANAIGTTYL